VLQYFHSYQPEGSLPLGCSTFQLSREAVDLL